MAVISRRVRSAHMEASHGLLSSRNSRYPAFLTATLEQGREVVMAGLRAEPTGTAHAAHPACPVPETSVTGAAEPGAVTGECLGATGGETSQPILLRAVVAPGCPFRGLGSAVWTKGV